MVNGELSLFWYEQWAHSTHKLYGQLDLNEDQFVLLYSFDTYFYDEATDFRFGNQSDIYAEIIDKATGNSVSGQVQLTSMIGNDDLVYFDIDDDNTISIAYTAIDYQYDGSWDRNEKTVFETYDSELARDISVFGPELASTGSSQSHLYFQKSEVTTDDVSDNNTNISTTHYEVTFDLPQTHLKII